MHVQVGVVETPLELELVLVDDGAALETVLEVVLVVELLELDELVEETVLDVNGAELLDGLGDAVKRQEQADDTLDTSKEH